LPTAQNEHAPLSYSLVQYADIALGMIAIGVLGLTSSLLIRSAGRLAMPWGRT